MWRAAARQEWVWIALVVGVALLAAWPAVGQPGLLNTRGGGDSPFLLQRLHQLTAALADGHFPTRWMPDANYGYGYPFYNFYAPLSIYIAAAFRFIGFSFVRSIHLAQLAGFVVAGLGTYALGRRWFDSRWSGLLSAVAYTVAPFHMVNVYVRGDSLAEFWAMAFYPLVLLAADGLLPSPGSGRPRTAGRAGARVALFALAYAALILSHNISALIFSPFLLLYVALRLWLRTPDDEPPAATDDSSARRPPSAAAQLAPPLAGFLLAFALAAWFFVPALGEQGLAQLGPVTEGYFHYSNHFRGTDLVQTTPGFDYSPDGGTAFRMGLVQAALALAGAAVVLLRWGRRGANGERPLARSRAVFMVTGLLVATLLITPLSRPLWDHLPLLPFTQFPWRFLSVQALFAALLTGALAHLPQRAFIVPVASIALLVAALLGLRVDHLRLTDADVTAGRLAEYEWFTGNIGTTVSAEYLPPWATPRPYSSAWLAGGGRDRASVLEGSAEVTLVERQTTRQQWDVSAGPDGATVMLPTLLWPGWRAALDGVDIPIEPQPGSGLIRLAVPAGDHGLELRLARTPLRLAAELVSLAALVAVIVLLVRGGGRLRRGPLIGMGAAALSLAALAVVLRLLPGPALPPDNLTWDFAQIGYLHHDVEGVLFEDGTRLLGYTYNAGEVRAGETLTVTLHLEQPSGANANLALGTPAMARPVPDGAADPPASVALTLPLSAAEVAFALPLPPTVPGGLLVPRLTLDGAAPLMPSGQTRGDLFLRPVRVLPADDGRALSTERLDVETIGLALVDDDALRARVAWWTDRPLGPLYVASLRLLDAGGGLLAQLDTQPGYGFRPTTSWPANRWLPDEFALALPEDLADGRYPLVIQLYDAGGDPVLVRRVGLLEVTEGDRRVLPHAPSFERPEGLRPLDVDFAGDNGDRITLLGYATERDGKALRLTLAWLAEGDLNGDYNRFVHLYDPVTEQIVAQADGIPAGNSLPTGQWRAGEVVTDAITLDLSAVPPGAYRLATGFYRPGEGYPRLATETPDGRVTLPDPIAVE
jgi:hypothetical protein